MSFRIQKASRVHPHFHLGMMFLLVLISCVSFYIYFRKKSRILIPLPPGPPADPIIGHLRLIPPDNQPTLFYKWGKIYGEWLFHEPRFLCWSLPIIISGDVMHLHFLGQPVIVLNSVQAAVDLLEKRSANYSDRPRLVVLEMFVPRFRLAPGTDIVLGWAGCLH